MFQHAIDGNVCHCLLSVKIDCCCHFVLSNQSRERPRIVADLQFVKIVWKPVPMARIVAKPFSRRAKCPTGCRQLLRESSSTLYQFDYCLQPTGCLFNCEQCDGKGLPRALLGYRDAKSFVSCRSEAQPMVEQQAIFLRRIGVKPEALRSSGTASSGIGFASKSFPRSSATANALPVSEIDVEKLVKQAKKSRLVPGVLVSRSLFRTRPYRPQPGPPAALQQFRQPALRSSASMRRCCRRSAKPCERLWLGQ